MTLEEARAEIAAIDREMAALFARRMAAAEPIAQRRVIHDVIGPHKSGQREGLAGRIEAQRPHPCIFR